MGEVEETAATVDVTVDKAIRTNRKMFILQLYYNNIKFVLQRFNIVVFLS